MFTKKIIFPGFIIIAFLISFNGFSQVQNLPKYEMGINLGGYIYQGDLTPHRFGSIETIKPGIGISGTRIISRDLSARLLFNIAKLKGDESVYKNPDYRRQRNFAFTTPVKELSLMLHWNILGSNYVERRFEPYLFVGAGLSFVKVKRDFSRLNSTVFGETSEVAAGLSTDIGTAPPRTIPVFPAGAGVRYNISDRVALNAEAAYRFMHTDYLDGFSHAANPKLTDHYSSISIGAAYKFGKKDKYGCPRPVN
ncbi:MAG: DUF6089 family protein [Ferruginibacter sp.]